MRMDRILANSGLGTRSQIKKLIREGGVCFGGEAVYDPSMNIHDDKLSSVTVLGKAIHFSKYIYLCLNKPDCCLTAMEDSRLPTVADYIPKELLGKGISPVGRLDYHTTGVLLITNDGELSHRLSGPKWHVPKSYIVTYSGQPLGSHEAELFAKGLVLLDIPGTKTVLSPATLEIIGENTCRLILYEGKTHQVKRMLSAVNRAVESLHREEYAGVRILEEQSLGGIRNLSPEELIRLLDQTGLTNRVK
jgi:16S rRNA pseudouridine516 synthase